MLFGSWIEEIVIEGTPGVSLMDLSVTLRPLVYKYVIVYRFESGIEHVRQARGALAGHGRRRDANSRVLVLHRSNT